MRYLIPVITAGAAIIVGVFSALGHIYSGYGIAAILLLIAGTIAIKEASREKTRPCIVPVRYGQITPVSFHGLIITNEHESVAYDISIPERQREIPIGSSRLVFWEKNIPRLTKGAEALIDTHIQLPSRTTLTGNGLHGQMVKNNVVDVCVPIVYKDADNHWYQTTCKIERDFHAEHGLAVRYVGLKRIKSPL